MARRLKVLFLCTGNSCRSQMAEGWARHLKSDRIDAHSAGLEARGLHPLTVQVMAEEGVDISGYRSKLVDAFAGVRFDHVVTLCVHAGEHCPILPGRAPLTAVDFEDPAVARGGEQQVLAKFRAVRDGIRAFVETLPEALDGG